MVATGLALHSAPRLELVLYVGAECFASAALVGRM